MPGRPAPPPLPVPSIWKDKDSHLGTQQGHLCHFHPTPERGPTGSYYLWSGGPTGSYPLQSRVPRRLPSPEQGPTGNYPLQSGPSPSLSDPMILSSDVAPLGWGHWSPCLVWA